MCNEHYGALFFRTKSSFIIQAIQKIFRYIVDTAGSLTEDGAGIVAE